MIAGPNGAGKSTFYELRIKPALRNTPFINADNIQRDELKTPSPEAAYGAAKIAEQRRQSHIEDKRSFITETTFSHPSKLELLDQARREGFQIIVYHISVGSADLSVARVKSRVAEGGHNVPAPKIRERFERNQALIRRRSLKQMQRLFMTIPNSTSRKKRSCILNRAGLSEQAAIFLNG